jgi:hypothetical protein
MIRVLQTNKRVVVWFRITRVSPNRERIGSATILQYESRQWQFWDTSGLWPEDEAFQMWVPSANAMARQATVAASPYSFKQVRFVQKDVQRRLHPPVRIAMPPDCGAMCIFSNKSNGASCFGLVDGQATGNND